MAEVGELFDHAIHMMNATLSKYCGPDANDSSIVGKDLERVNGSILENGYVSRLKSGKFPMNEPGKSPK